jgi:1-deoxy-D-xylulose-5-phosphate synthase
MPGPTGLIPFQERFPDRFFDVGIAEQHAVTAAAGMAMGGLRPVVAIYSTFLSRAWDQVVYDVALHRLGVVFCLDRAGITGPDGPSHHGVYDMAMLTKVPGMRVLAPSSASELRRMVLDAVTLADSGPVVIRYPRGTAPDDDGTTGEGLRARRLVQCETAPDVAICAVGRMVRTALEVAGKLTADGHGCTVWDVRSCAPLDPDMIADAHRHRLVLTIEDGIAAGGVGERIAAELGDAAGPAPTVVVRGLPTTFIPHGSPEEILARVGLDAAGLTAAVMERLT